MTWEYVTDVESDSKPGVSYAIKRNPMTGRLGCDCVSYRFAPAEAKTCKHIIAYQEGYVGQGFVAAQAVDRAERRTKHGTEIFVFRRAISFNGIPS